ncbi:ATP-binding cassette domain-containing protein [Bacillus licheniformis]|nr:ATP-binding cassette domain-containing protein [Bacillus licheniformis]
MLAARPDIMILDEATSMLDPMGREEVLDTVRRLKDQGMVTVISITHDLNEAAKADRIVRKKVGMVFQNPDNQFVGTTVRDDVAFGLENSGVPREDMVERVDWAVQQVNMQEFLDQEPHHLSGGRYQKDADRPALDHVSFHVSKGEWLAIVGHNGSGKSTLARALNGLILPDEGSIKVGGIKLTEETVWDVELV